jgi:hypothetical protein
VVDFTSRINRLRVRFGEIIGRAESVGAAVWMQSGDGIALTFIRSEKPVFLVAVDDELSPPAVNADQELDPVGNVFLELRVLTKHAGTLLRDLIQAGQYMPTLIKQGAWDHRYAEHPLAAEHPVLVQHLAAIDWISYLLFSLETFGCCLAKGPEGMVTACGQIRDGESTSVWIARYAEVCLLALTELEGHLLAIPAQAQSRDEQASTVSNDRAQTSATAPSDLNDAASVSASDSPYRLKQDKDGSQWLLWQDDTGLHQEPMSAEQFKLLRAMEGKGARPRTDVIKEIDSGGGEGAYYANQNRLNNSLRRLGAPFHLGTVAPKRIGIKPGIYTPQPDRKRTRKQNRKRARQ